MAAIFIAASTIGKGQSYTISPNDSIVASAPFNDLKHYNIFQTNNSGKKLVLTWKQLRLTIPKGWMANLCDNGHCYNDFPKSGTMDTVSGSDYGLIAVGIDPGVIVGTGIIQYEVWDVNFTLKKDTLTWIITANNTSEINTLGSDNRIHIFPNPAKNNLEITSNITSDFEISITNILGKEIYNTLSHKKSILISSENFANGIYYVSIKNSNKIINSQKLIIQH